MSRELIRKARDGNLQALNELINNHKELAFSIALKHLKNKEDAEDVVQNSFIIVLKSIKNFRNEAKFSTWLYSIIYHECLKELKKRYQTIEYIPQFYEVEREETLQGETISVENLIKSLKPNEYTVVTLHYLKEKSIREVAKITSLSTANVKTILHRARKKMKNNNKKDN